MHRQLPLIAIVTAIVLMGIGVAAFIFYDPQILATGIARGEPKAWERKPIGGGDQEALTAGSAVAMADYQGDWSSFLGPAKDGIAPDDGVALATDWPDGGPSKVWERVIGNGHAGVAIHKGRVFLTDYDPEIFPDPQTGEPVGGDIIRCLSLADGQDIWSYAYAVTSVNNHGVSRPVPAVTDDYLVSFGPKCQVYCVKTDTGEKVWSMDLRSKYGAEVPKWYAGQCPLIVGDSVILAPSGKAGAGVEARSNVLMVKVKLATGEVVWEAENTLLGIQTHVSIAEMDCYGTPSFVYSGGQGLIAVNAENGEILWESKEWFNKIANCATPVPVSDNRVFLSAGYGSGCMMMKINKDANGRFMPEVLWTKQEEEFGSVQHTPLYVPQDEVIYGIRVNGEMVCMELDGTFRWSSGKEKTNRYGIGPYLMSAQGLIYALEGHGRLDMVRANPDKFEKLDEHYVWGLRKGKTDAGAAKDAWGPMALAGGYLILRDIKRLVCLDVSAGTE